MSASFTYRACQCFIMLFCYLYGILRTEIMVLSLRYMNKLFVNYVDYNETELWTTTVNRLHYIVYLRI